MRVLVLSFYYPRDVAPSAFRTAALVKDMRAAMPPGSQIDVVTTMPNRYGALEADAPAREAQPGLCITRIKVGSHGGGMLRQSLAFASYARAVERVAARQRYDVVYASSGRLMTAALGARLARRTGARLYLDIRDIFAEIMPQILPGGAAGVLAPILSRLERSTIGRADRVNLVSPGFGPYFTARYPGKAFTYLTNGIDDEFVDAASRPQPTEKRGDGVRPVRIVYAGNIGEGQRLHAIIPPMAAELGERVCFKVIGAGGRRRELLAAVSAAGLTNVDVVAPMGRTQLLEEYGGADVLFLHLSAYHALESVLPSKLFEYGATGKPILAGVSGYPADFVRGEIENAAVFDPCDVGGAIRALDSLELRTRARAEFLKRFTRGPIRRALAADVRALAAEGPG